MPPVAVTAPLTSTAVSLKVPRGACPTASDSGSTAMAPGRRGSAVNAAAAAAGVEGCCCCCEGEGDVAADVGVGSPDGPEGPGASGGAPSAGGVGGCTAVSSTSRCTPCNGDIACVLTLLDVCIELFTHELSSTSKCTPCQTGVQEARQEPGSWQRTHLSSRNNN